MTYHSINDRMKLIDKFSYDEIDSVIAMLERLHEKAQEDLKRLMGTKSGCDEAIWNSYYVDSLSRRVARLDNKLTAYYILKENNENEENEDEALPLIRYSGTMWRTDPVSEIILEQKDDMVKVYEIDLWEEHMERKMEEDMSQDMFD